MWLYNPIEILREKTPIGKLEELEGASHPFQEKEPLKPFPDGVNPKTGNLLQRKFNFTPK